MLPLRGTLAIIILLTQNDLVSPSKVYFSLIVSYGRFGFNSSGAVPAIDIALDYVKRNQILPNYELAYERAADSEVGTQISMVTYLYSVAIKFTIC